MAERLSRTASAIGGGNKGGRGRLCHTWPFKRLPVEPDAMYSKDVSEEGPHPKGQ